MASEYRTPSNIHPCLTYENAPAAIAWLCRVFGFTQQLVVPGPDGSVLHSELSLGTGVVMVSSAKPEFNRHPPRSTKGAPASLSVYIPDPDTHHKRVAAAGARVTQPLRDEEYGARGYGVEDLEGHQWYFGNYRPGGYWEHPPAVASTTSEYYEDSTRTASSSI